MKKCSTCNTEDCNCVCYICEENQPKNSSAVSKRKTCSLDHTPHQFNSPIESKQKTETDKEEISSL